MTTKRVGNLFDVLNNQNQKVPGMVVEKVSYKYKVYQDGYYAGTMDAERANNLKLIPSKLQQKFN